MRQESDCKSNKTLSTGERKDCRKHSRRQETWDQSLVKKKYQETWGTWETKDNKHQAWIRIRKRITDRTGRPTTPFLGIKTQKIEKPNTKYTLISVETKNPSSLETKNKKDSVWLKNKKDWRLSKSKQKRNLEIKIISWIQKKQGEGKLDTITSIADSSVLLLLLEEISIP